VRRLGAGKTEHEALVARALLGGGLALGGFFVHALRDVGLCAVSALRICTPLALNDSPGSV